MQADLRTFASHRVHGTVVLTAVTAQNTLGVQRVDALSADAITAQFQALISDIPIQALKTGVLVNTEIVKTVAANLQALALTQQPQIVVDPVMVSRAGSVFVDAETVTALQTELIPQAQILTPNRYEAQILAAMEIQTLAEMKTAAQKIRTLGCEAVLVKGGAMPGELRGLDVWWDGTNFEILQTELVTTPHTHGSGCTLAAAITANLAWNQPPLIAVQNAKTFVTQALHYSYPLGSGQGPLGHFYVDL
jgi:hydroxymethylpyrimidine/phosphomethylpyrimidine kinase